MRRTVFLALVLVAPLASGQATWARYEDAEPDAAAAYAPLEVIVQTVPRLVALALAEASRDGTPDAAEALAADLDRYAGELQFAGPWPDRATTPSLHQEHFAAGAELAAVAAAIPEDAGRAARGIAACASWSGNATDGERRGWASATWPALARLTLAASGIERVRERLPAEIPLERLSHTGAALRAWVDAREAEASACLPASDPPAAEGGGPGRLSASMLTLAPPTAWPTTTVLAQGTVDPRGTLRLVAASLALDLAVETDAAGRFAASFRVPVDAEIGRHVVRAETAEAPLVTAVLDVARAPSELRVVRPAEVVVGGRLELRTTVVSPLTDAVGEGPIRVTGGVDGSSPLRDGAATFAFVAPAAPGLLRAKVAYPGNALVEPSTAFVTVAVVPDGVNVAPGLPPALGDRGLFGIRVDETWIVAVLGAGVLGAVTLRLRRRAARGEAESASDPDGVGEVTSPDGGVFTISRAFVLLARLLLALGLARPSQTAREMADRLRAHGVVVDDEVAAFERERYGRTPQPAEPTRLASWLNDLRRRIGGEAP